MKVIVSTHLNASPEKVWSTVKTKELLFYVMKPMARFTPTDAATKGMWQEGKRYQGKSYMFSIIPVGTRTIFLERIDDESRTIQSREKGEIGLKKWDHLITVEPEGEGTRYTDLIEIDAGVFTPLYWTYASFFYRHRQRRWRKLVENNFQYK